MPHPRYGIPVVITGVDSIVFAAEGAKGIILGAQYVGAGTCVIEDGAQLTTLCRVPTGWGLFVPFRFHDGATLSITGVGGSATAVWAPLK